MVKKSNPSEVNKVPCHICQKEIPLSEAKSAEAVDYIVHFCGLECYTKWKQMSESEQAGLQSSVARKR